MTSATAGPFTLNVELLAAASVTAGARAGSAPLAWQASMLEGDVLGALSTDVPPDPPVSSYPLPPGDVGGDIFTDDDDDLPPPPPDDMGGVIVSGP
jgi:hypothetical protein